MTMETDPTQTADSGESGGEEFGGKCHHTCPETNCVGRCEKATGHGGPHECGVNPGHPTG